MKTIKALLPVVLIILMAITGCEKKQGPKGDQGATGPQGASGPSAKTFTFTGNFNSTTQFIYYTGLMSSFDADDVVITYIFNANYGGTDYYVMLPYVVSGFVNVYAEVGENGSIYINTDKADGSAGSPWTSPATFQFKAVLIKSSQIKKHPNVDYSNYSEVKATFNLQD